MQDRYVGDVGDLGKFGLLRRISGITDTSPEPHLQLGVVWQHHHDEKHPPGNKAKMSADGRHISYLRRTSRDDRAEYRNCDVELWESLRDLVYRDGRCVHCAESANLLPADTMFFTDMLHFFESMRRPLREQVRAAWVRGALRATQGASVVFFDPDNGIGNERKRFKGDGTKYVYISELRDFWERNQSLVVYHHASQGKTVERQARDLMATLEVEFGLEPIPLLFSRGTSRLFIVIPQPNEAGAVIEDRIDRMLETGWNRHFEKIQCEED